MTATTAPASDKQKSFLLKLAGERVAPFLGDTALERVYKVNESIRDGLTKSEATGLISNLLKQKVDAQGVPTAATTQVKTVSAALTPGVYDVDGKVYVVKPNQKKTALYAMRLVEIAGERLNLDDELVKIEFVYAPGVIFNIKPEHKMPLDQAKKLTIRYGRCIVCGKRLKAGKSVEQGIGPVCIKSFDY